MNAKTTEEVELKFGLPDDAAFERILTAPGVRVLSTDRQANHFFDTADLSLDAAHYTCRLRIEGKGHTLTIKGPRTAKSADNFITENPEVEWRIEMSQGRALLSGSTSPLDLVSTLSLGLAERGLIQEVSKIAGGKPLVNVGYFMNERTTTEWPVSLAGGAVIGHLEFDETMFPNGNASFEVELEMPTGADHKAYEQAARRLFQQAGVQPVPLPSKAARFFATRREERRLSTLINEAAERSRSSHVRTVVSFRTADWRDLMDALRALKATVGIVLAGERPEEYLEKPRRDLVDAFERAMLHVEVKSDG